jgi:nucleotide-binding universal stress UspA family protein
MFETIVLAVDGSEPSDRAVTYARELAKSGGGRIIAVHVKEIMAGRAAGPVHPNEEEILERIRGQITQLKDDGIDATLEVTSTMAGGPAHVIADTAEKQAADVIVTGTRGHTAIAGVLLGSVAQRLLHLAHCPVLVVPDMTARGGAAPAGREASTTA